MGKNHDQILLLYRCYCDWLGLVFPEWNPTYLCTICPDSWARLSAPLGNIDQHSSAGQPRYAGWSAFALRHYTVDDPIRQIVTAGPNSPNHRASIYGNAHSHHGTVDGRWLDCRACSGAQKTTKPGRMGQGVLVLYSHACPDIRCRSFSFISARFSSKGKGNCFGALSYCRGNSDIRIQHAPSANIGRNLPAPQN